MTQRINSSSLCHQDRAVWENVWRKSEKEISCLGLDCLVTHWHQSRAEMKANLTNWVEGHLGSFEWPGKDGQVGMNRQKLLLLVVVSNKKTTQQETQQKRENKTKKMKWRSVQECMTQSLQITTQKSSKHKTQKTKTKTTLFMIVEVYECIPHLLQKEGRWQNCWPQMRLLLLITFQHKLNSLVEKRESQKSQRSHYLHWICCSVYCSMRWTLWKRARMRKQQRLLSLLCHEQSWICSNLLQTTTTLCVLLKNAQIIVNHFPDTQSLWSCKKRISSMSSVQVETTEMPPLSQPKRRRRVSSCWDLLRKAQVGVIFKNICVEFALSNPILATADHKGCVDVLSLETSRYIWELRVCWLSFDCRALWTRSFEVWVVISSMQCWEWRFSFCDALIVFQWSQTFDNLKRHSGFGRGHEFLWKHQFCSFNSSVSFFQSCQQDKAQPCESPQNVAHSQWNFICPYFHLVADAGKNGFVGLTKIHFSCFQKCVLMKFQLSLCVSLVLPNMLFSFWEGFTNFVFWFFFGFLIAQQVEDTHEFVINHVQWHTMNPQLLLSANCFDFLVKLCDIRCVCDPVQLFTSCPKTPGRCSIIHKFCFDFDDQHVLASVVQFSPLFFLDTLTNHSNLFFVSFSSDTYVNWCWCTWHSKQVRSFEWARSWSNIHQRTLLTASLKCKLQSRLVRPLVCSVLKRKMEFWVFFFVVRNNKTNNKKHILSLFSLATNGRSQTLLSPIMPPNSSHSKRRTYNWQCFKSMMLFSTFQFLWAPLLIFQQRERQWKLKKAAWDHCSGEWYGSEDWWMQSSWMCHICDWRTSTQKTIFFCVCSCSDAHSHETAQHTTKQQQGATQVYSQPTKPYQQQKVPENRSQNEHPPQVFNKMKKKMSFVIDFKNLSFISQNQSSQPKSQRCTATSWNSHKNDKLLLWRQELCDSRTTKSGTEWKNKFGKQCSWCWRREEFQGERRRVLKKRRVSEITQRSARAQWGTFITESRNKKTLNMLKGHLRSLRMTQGPQKRQECRKWKRVMNEEMKVHQNSTCRFEKNPKERKLIESKWVFKIKRGPVR